MSEARWFNTR